MSEKIKIIVAEDHQLVREAFAFLLKNFDFIEILGMAENGIEALELLKEKEPDILFLDIEMPLMNGETTAKEVKKKFPNVKIIVLSMYNESYYILEFFRIGVNCYLTKGCSTEKLITAINSVYNEGEYFDEDIAQIIQRNTKIKPENCILGQEPLEEAETEVLKLLCEGKRGKEISEKLQISIDTINFHKRSLKNKTGCDSTAQLVVYAIRNGIISLKER